MCLVALGLALCLDYWTLSLGVTKGVPVMSNVQRLNELCDALSQALNVISFRPTDSLVGAEEYGLACFYAAEARGQVRAILSEVDRHERAINLDIEAIELAS